MARYPKGSSPKLTPELIEEISLLLRKGCYVETAAAACGISKDTFYRWLRTGKSNPHSLESKLSDAILKSMAQSELHDLEVIDKAAQGSADLYATDEQGNVVIDSEGRPVVIEYGLPPNWKVAAWRLERKFPDRWGRKSKVELETDSTPLEIVFVDPEIAS